MEWVIDSGATHHITNEIDKMSKIKTLMQPLKMGCANSGNLIIDRVGQVIMKNPYDNQMVKLTKVRYAKNCPKNLLSERRLRHKIIFLTLGNEKHLIDRETGKTLHIAKQDGRFWLVKMTPMQLSLIHISEPTRPY